MNQVRWNDLFEEWRVLGPSEPRPDNNKDLLNPWRHLFGRMLKDPDGTRHWHSVYVRLKEDPSSPVSALHLEGVRLGYDLDRDGTLRAIWQTDMRPIGKLICMPTLVADMHGLPTESH